MSHERLYHVTPVENKNSILRDGLRGANPDVTPWDPEKGGGALRYGVVHFARGIADARKWSQQIENAYDEHDQANDEDYIGGQPMRMSLFRLDKPEGLPITHATDPQTGLSESMVAKDVPAHLLRHIADFYPWGGTR